MVIFKSGSFKSRLRLIQFPKLRLSHQLLGFFTLIILLPLLLLSFSIYTINQRALQKQVAEFTASTAEAVYDEMQLEMHWQGEQAELASQYWAQLLNMHSKANRNKQIDRFFAQYPDYEAVGWYDKQGHLQYGYGKNTLSLPKILGHQPKFQLHYEQGNNYSLEISSPLAKNTVVFLKRFPYLGKMIFQRYNTFHTGLLVIDTHGVVLAGTHITQKISPDDLNHLQSLKEGMKQQYNDEAPRFEKVLLKLPETGWGLIIESPYHVERSYITKARNQSVMMVFLCVLVVIILGSLYYRQINRNFRQLIKGIKALAEGKYTRKIRLITRSWTPFEIVYLTAEFNRMATKISTAWTSIQKLNHELERANVQLSKLDELKSNLIDTVSHELRTPLTNIKGYTSRLMRYDDTLDMETKMKSLKVIKQQTDRLSRLVEDLLVIPDLEREEGIRVFPDRVNLHDLVTRCVGFITEKAACRIQINALPEDVDILVDPDRPEQVLLNLLDNAVKYSPEEATVEVEVIPSHSGFIQIQVFNPCEAIPDEELAKLFTKFKRLDERLTRTTRGTGLGLFITKGLVEAMGGTIQLEGKDGFRVLLDIPLWEQNTRANEAFARV